MDVKFSFLLCYSECLLRVCVGSSYEQDHKVAVHVYCSVAFTLLGWCMAQVGRWLPIFWNNMSVPSSSVEQCEKNTGSRWMHRGQCEAWLVLRKRKGTRKVAGARSLHDNMTGAARAWEGNEEAREEGGLTGQGQKKMKK